MGPANTRDESVVVGEAGNENKKTKNNARNWIPIEYKRKIIDEYLAGALSAQAIAEREGFIVGQIYKWRVQLNEHAREDRLEQIQLENPEATLALQRFSGKV